ncbi:hypothetical protein [Streptomyces chartreusis]|uniref:hypothetical protein n=1 Tax=Streptomyces chartreusis TaxID=1969 RepID=UPI0033FD3B3F
MSAFRSDPDLNVQDSTGNGTEVDVATHLLNGSVRLSILWTQEILLSADAAEHLAEALQRAAVESRNITDATATQPGPAAD